MATTQNMSRAQRTAAELSASFTVVIYAKLHAAPRRALLSLKGPQITTPTNTSCQECNRLRSLFRNSANGNYTVEGISRVARLHDMHRRMNASRTGSDSDSDSEVEDKENCGGIETEEFGEESGRESIEGEEW